MQTWEELLDTDRLRSTNTEVDSRSGIHLKAAPKSLLLVEDEMIIAMAQAVELESEGFRVTMARSGLEAVEKVRSGPDEIDLILMDIDLGGGMDGTEAAQRILEDHDVPILFVSSHTEKEIVERTEGITSYGYVVKSAGMTVLVASIKMAFKLHEAHRLLEVKERQIRKSEEIYQATFETTGAATVIFNEDTIIINANAKFSQLSGYPLQDIIGKMKWTDFVVKDELECLLSLHRLRSKKSEAAPKEYEFRIIDKSGGILDIFMTIDMIPGTMYRVASLMDITGRKRMERQLLDKEEQAQRYFNNPVLGIFQATPEGTLTMANQALANMLGYESAEDLLSGTERQVSKLYANPAFFNEIDDKILNAESLQEFETEFFREDGSTMTGYLFIWPVRDADDNVILAEGFAYDITGQKQAEGSLRATMQQLHDIIDFLPDPTFVIDQDRCVMFWNKAIEKMTGVKKEEIIGKGNYSYGCPFYLGKEPVLIDLIFSSSAELEAKYNYVRRIGDTIYAERFIPDMNQGAGGYLWGAAAPLFDSDGRRTGAIEVIRDITDRKREEKALAKSLEEKSVLFKEFRHRVKNNLQIVKSLLSLGMDELTDDHSKKIFGDAVCRVQAISTIYEQLNTVDNLQKFNLNEYIRKMTVLLINTYSMRNTHFNLIMDLDEVSLDDKRIVPVGLILNEAITNALKYAYPQASNGEIHVQLRKNGGYVTLTVSDYGIGLPEDVRNCRTRGMGLQLIEMLTNQIGGEFAIDSDNGTTVRVAFRE